MNAPDSFCFYVMINIENISISFGNLTLFRGLDLQVHYGESVCICGGSGSGKSSLLKAVLGFVPSLKGTKPKTAFSNEDFPLPEPPQIHTLSP